MLVTKQFWFPLIPNITLHYVIFFHRVVIFWVGYPFKVAFSNVFLVKKFE